MNSVETELRKFRKVLSRNLKRLRKENSLSQEKLAWEASVDRTVVSKIEREVTNPSIDILIRLAFCLRVPVATLLEIEFTCPDVFEPAGFRDNDSSPQKSSDEASED